MTDFIRFPHTPHLTWLAAGQPRVDKVMTRQEADDFLSGPVILEEKVDGANLGLSFDDQGNLRVQNRGGWLVPPFAGQFQRLDDWLASHLDGLFDQLGADLILFGEWCAATHSLYYDHLPDWFLGFDLFQRQDAQFLDVVQRNAALGQLGLKAVPELGRGQFTLDQLAQELAQRPSQLREGPLEGFYVRREADGRLTGRAKLVRAGFTQAIDDHWRQRAISWNRRDFG